MPTAATAQPRHHKHAAETDTVSVLVRQYTDSLLRCRRQIDSLQAIVSSNRTEYTPDNKYYQLFVPMTFYHSIAHDRFSLDADTTTSVLDDALLSVYFRRPDLVQSTQSKINIIGPILNPQPAEVKPNTEMVDKETPTPVDTDIDRIDIMVKRPNFWHFSGEFRIDLSQNYYSGNWYQGGESNYTTTQYLKLYAQYNDKRRFSMDHMIEGKLGFNSSKTDTIHSVQTNASDLHYRGNYNLRAFKKWSYSLQVDARTQIMRIFDKNSHHVRSDFGSPLYVNVSLGMIYDFNSFKGKLVCVSETRTDSVVMDTLDATWAISTSNKLTLNDVPLVKLLVGIKNAELTEAAKAMMTQTITADVTVNHVSPIVFTVDPQPLTTTVRFGGADHQLRITFANAANLSWGSYSTSDKSVVINLVEAGVYLDGSSTNLLPKRMPLLWSTQQKVKPIP